jgi:hypothetical protein
MSIFKIKIKPVIKEREYKVSHVRAGRKAKRCAICERVILVGKPSITFTKITSVGEKNNFETYHSCPINGEHSHCAQKLAEKLNTDLNETST